MSPEPAQAKPEAPGRCQSCQGTGEVGSDFGPASCPDCGGAGYLPSPHALVEWRARDIELAHANGTTAVARDVRFLLAELRRARDALTEISALSHELDDANPVAARLRYTVNQALRLYEIRQEAGKNEAPGA
jgi:hypothetical protein